MVKIINGEIVQDNDPRLRKTISNTTSTSSTTPITSGNRGGGNRRIHNLNSINNNNENEELNNNQTPNNNLYPQNNNNLIRQQQQQYQNPLDLLAKALKIDDRTITIPAIPQLKLTESKIGLIYFLMLGLLCLIFGIRTLLFGVFVYVIFKHSEKKNE